MNGTQRMIVHLAWVAGLIGVTVAIAQQSSPAAVNGCVYNATPPTLTDKQSTVFQCDVNGKLLVK